MAIVEHTSSAPAAPVSRQRYVRPPQPIHFPVSEEMPETNRHMELRTALYQILQQEIAARATIGSDQFVYYDPTTARKRLAPDVFVRLGAPHATFRSWKTWQRGAPDLGVEIVSDSDEGDEAWDTKLERYRAAGIAEVVRFDPDDAARPIRVWDHIDGDLVERAPAEDGAIECIALGLYWVAAPHPSFTRMLRLARDRAGSDLLPTLQEARQAAERARREAERARQEEALARQEEARARREAERAQQEEALARQEEARARALAEQERDRLAAELSELRKRLEQAPTSTTEPGKPGTGKAGRRGGRGAP